MSVFPNKLKSVAKRLLSSVANGGKGLPLILTSYSAESYDDSLGKNTRTGYDRNVEGVQGLVESDDLSDLVVATDIKFVIPYCDSTGAILSPEPKNGDLIVAGSNSYVIITVKELAPSGTPILYKVFCRNA